MASIIWMAIFALLVVELVIVLILCLPLPRRARNVVAREIFKLNLEDTMKKPMIALGAALCLALVESYFTHQRIMTRLYGAADGEGGGENDHYHHHHRDRFYPNLMDKERKYKSERNLYLAGFALTLLFAIGRLTALLQESVELHDEMERLLQKKQQQTSSASSESTTKDKAKAN
mmetsp:Transcript_20370/g.48431  ORF Transcript_20370/g.48431 Transcript_20370/m.48431 type:complete len:175 (+) Transcript_20370:103-627(+)|eukprot:CAMPEP_0113465658 /NCGR_PEP_ID=MMETSP0014_2-20120614/13860_1 /TAXON_ID=2857 /ORGANISM="Nitzschia sp." /LENGTH=174 /DNA_ID=CAMNT_0000357837 /DNA_START=85 /DNA_END=609 /DNA_ORIENTATION=+ /assembly_acc=CAM_ASM_000159